MSEVTRRNFMKTAGATASVMAATGFSPFSYAANEKVRIGSIGVGPQGRKHIQQGLTMARNIKHVAVCDIQKFNLNLGWSEAGGDVNMPKYTDYREMLDKEELDAVVIATPLATHYGIVMDCLDAGKYVFCEKTLTYDIEHARDIVKKCNETGLFLQVGHQRRYNPQYNHALNMAISENALGRIYHIDAQWHRNNEWRRDVSNYPALDSEELQYIPDLEKHVNWRLYQETSGGLMTELATHSLDVVNWVLDANPTRVVGYGGIDYWRDGRDVFDNINVIYEYDITPESRAYKPIKGRNAGQVDNPNLNDPYTVRVVYSSITANAKRGASELIKGDQGAFELTEGRCLFYQEPTSEVLWADRGRRDPEDNAIVIQAGSTLALSNTKLGKGKGLAVNVEKDPFLIQMEQFATDVQTNGMPKANQMVAFKSAVTALTGMKAMRERREVIIDPAVYDFDFETPDSSVISV